MESATQLCAASQRQPMNTYIHLNIYLFEVTWGGWRETCHFLKGVRRGVLFENFHRFIKRNTKNEHNKWMKVKQKKMQNADEFSQPCWLKADCMARIFAHFAFPSICLAFNIMPFVGAIAGKHFICGRHRKWPNLDFSLSLSRRLQIIEIKMKLIASFVHWGLNDSVKLFYFLFGECVRFSWIHLRATIEWEQHSNDA